MRSVRNDVWEPTNDMNPLLGRRAHRAADLALWMWPNSGRDNPTQAPLLRKMRSA